MALVNCCPSRSTYNPKFGDAAPISPADDGTLNPPRVDVEDGTLSADEARLLPDDCTDKRDTGTLTAFPCTCFTKSS